MSPGEQQGNLEARLRAAEQQKEGSYDKRTDHLAEDGSTLFINRLILEDSPYLLQHAHNPVNWYPWGPEAFAAAKEEHKPVFLSIGYSTCHWCHVMEVESFDNVEVARILNEKFISIKMDREQYPDIDEIYMTGVQLMSGQGGWPMTNFLMPNGDPFFGATYFRPEEFMRLLRRAISAWEDRHEELIESAENMRLSIRRVLSAGRKRDGLDGDLVSKTIKTLLLREDKMKGGLAGAPKFPQEPLLLLLLDQAARHRNHDALAFVSRALHAMGRGGIYDQVAGGFHRYSVDDRWLVPHFEKMLYNQSQLGLAYLQAWVLSGEPFFRRILTQTLDYVLRDMQMEGGGFYSATDADSEGAEGTFFLWSRDQVSYCVGDEECDTLCELFGLTEFGNFEGSNILNLPVALDKFAEARGGDEFYPRLDTLLHKLYQCREQRVHPIRDDKLIVAWTGTMISALARSGFVLGNSAWMDGATAAAERVLAVCLDEDGRLNRILLADTVSIAAQLEDYANMVLALLDLYDFTVEHRWLARAAELADTMIEEFYESETGRFYLSPETHEAPQLIRSSNPGDGAIMSPIANALDCLLRLFRRSGRLDDNRKSLTYRECIEQGLQSVYGQVNENPLMHPSLLRVVEDFQNGSRDPVQFAGNGLARIGIRKLPQGKGLRLDVEVDVADSWHVTAQGANGEEFKPFTVALAPYESCWQLVEIQYPDSSALDTETDVVPPRVYQGRFNVTLELAPGSQERDEMAASVGVRIKLQLCSETECLLSEELLFRV